MASESVEEKKQDEEAPPAVEGKEAPKREEDGVEKDQVKEEVGAEEEGGAQEEEDVKEEVSAEEGKEGEEENPEQEDVKEEVGAEEGKGDAQEEEDVKEDAEDVEEEVKEESKKQVKIPRKRGSKASAEKKEPVTPSSDRPTRERKIVERYSVPDPGRSVTKTLSIEKGRGTQLKDIPNVAYKLSKRKPDENLQMLHTVLFGKKAKAHNLKKDISQFSGYVWIENEEKQKSKVREKLDKCVKEKLLDFCDLLNIPINKANVKKEELTGKILDFLESPHATTDVLLADKEQKGKKRKTTPGKNASPGEASVTPAKKRKQTSPTGEKRKHSSKDDEEEDEDRVESPEAKDDPPVDSEDDSLPNKESDQEEDNSEEEEEPEEPTKKVSSKKGVKQSSGAKSVDKTAPEKKGTPAKPVKSPAKSAKRASGSSKKGASDADGASGSVSKPKGSASKKQKVEEEDLEDENVSSKNKVTNKKKSGNLSSKASAKDQGKMKAGKKAKPEPTRKDMHAVVVDILKEVDFNTATLSDILRQLGTHFGVDLMHRKAEVKDIITDVINSMSDEEEEEEGDENAEAGGDEDKDGDDEDGDGDDA